ncbi:hypothetical protein SAMN05443582_101520 [Phyllobacterium sp. OV277]|nr:hypothetical protein SAMN05443582_101520 [Phyllobacterium sp. OV277]
MRPFLLMDCRSCHAWFTVRGSWFDKLTMRGLGGCNDNRKHSITNVAELDSLQPSTPPHGEPVEPRHNGVCNWSIPRLDLFEYENSGMSIARGST